MGKLGVRNFSLSLDGYGAGPNQDMNNPLGMGGFQLHNWFFPTRSFQIMNDTGKDGTTGLDDNYARLGFENVGGWILGRNMFGPIRGAWPDESWKGWWGANPPFHGPVFVLTHHPRKPLKMEGGTTFHFVTEGYEVALKQAKEAAGQKDVRLGGGVNTVRQYLKAKLIDEIHLAIAPILIGSGEPLLSGLDLPALGYQVAKHEASEAVIHITIVRATTK
jgi:dihydrofolate reductase